jgi:hypothetical protein
MSAHGPLDVLRTRLRSGIATAQAAEDDRRDPLFESWWPVAEEPPKRLVPHQLDSGQTVRRWIETAESVLGTGGTPSASDVDALIGQYATWLAKEPSRLIWTARHPWQWLDELHESLRRRGYDQADPRTFLICWYLCCWAVEAMTKALVCPDCALPSTDRAVVEPLAARTRFLVLSEPLRHRGVPSSAWFSREALNGEAVTCVLGANSWNRMLDRIRDSRWGWLQHLNGFGAYPPLAEASGRALEHELRLLVFTDVRRPAGTCLALRADLPHLPVRPGPEDRSVQDEVTTKHLLPRFRLATAASLGLRSGGRAVTARMPDALRPAMSWVHDAMPPVCAIGVVVAMAVTGWLVAKGDFHAAAEAALSTYVTIGVGVLLNGPLFAALWLLRWPAAAIIGVIALAGLNPSWWRDGLPPLFVVGHVPISAVTVVLAAGAYGYLVVEARNHRVDAAFTMPRALAVQAIGTLHAVLIALIGLLFVIPEFGEDGMALRGLLTGHDCVAAYRVLADTTAWCLAAGVFSQILWDDRSITAPLAHTRWQSERPR